MEIVGLLAARRGFTRYLELCTPTTGNYYRNLDRQVLPVAHRLMYNCPADFDDGMTIDFRSEGPDIGQCLAELSRKRLRYDIILVDPFHEYDTSYRDLCAAFDLIDDGGMLVVHDCLPPNAAMAVPGFIVGEWCGVTYKAYLDFVGGRRDLDYRTVATDYGCGIIQKLGRQSLWGRLLREPRSPQRPDPRRLELLWRQWREIGNDVDRSFGFFEKHKKELLRLISPDEFLATL